MILQRKFTYYSLALLFIWACGGGGSKAPTEPVEPAPVSNFTATPTSGLQPLEVVFTSTATGTITSYAWNVDADTDIEGTAATYTHTYTDVGTYSVTLTVTGPGGSNPKTVADMITVTSAAPTPTTATTQTTQEDGSTTISLTATDPNGQAVTFAITTDPTNGTASLSGTEITYTPNANFYGTDSFDYTASNGTYTSDPVTITITVTGEDDGNPTTNDVSATTDEDTAVTVNLDATEIDGDNYSFSIVTQPTNGTLGSVSGNQVEYTPNANWNGTDTFTFEATDDRTFRRNVATATITVNAINDAPVANDVTVSTNETRFISVDITLDASDVEGDALTYSVVGTNNGTVSINGSIATYIPTTDWNGTDTFTYKANDGTDDSNTATATITVAAVNDAPIANDISVSTNEDTAIDITLNATDVEGDALTYSVVVPTNGTVSSNGSVVTYTPNADFNGTDTFTYKANDGSLDSNTATVTVTVAAVNDAPVANDVTVSTNETRFISVDVTFSASDVEGDALTYSVVSNPSNGTLGSVSGAIVTYTPTTDWNGSDTFTYKANDGTDDSNTATVTITVAAVNDAPTSADEGITTNEDTAVRTGFSSSDVEGDALTYSVIAQPTNGTVTIDNSNSEPGLYTPNADFNGTDTFTYKANDGSLDSNTATVTVTVAAVNDAPTTNDVSATTKQNTAVDITLSAADVDGDALSYTLSSPSNGTVSISASVATYTPTSTFVGTDTFTYSATDGLLSSNTSTVTITVTNDAPVANNLSVNTNEDTAVTITLSATDADGDNLTYTIVSNPSNGALGTLSGTSVDYTPNANWNGTDTFTYKANDGTSDSNTATVTITVAVVNDAPVASNVSASGRKAVAKAVTLSVTDPDGDNLTYSIVSDPSNGTVSVSGSTATYTSSSSFSVGTDTFTYKANDGTADSNTATVSISVTNPFLLHLSASTDIDNPKYVSEDSSGNYVVASNDRIQKFDYAGNEQFRIVILDDSEIGKLQGFTINTDEDYVICGQGDDDNNFYISKYSSSGSFVSEHNTAKPSGLTTKMHCFDISQTSDGGYILGATNGQKSVLLKFDSSLNKTNQLLIDQDLYGYHPAGSSKDKQEGFADVHQVADDGYVIATNNHLVKIGSNLTDYTWLTSTSGNSGTDGVKVFDKTSDGGFIMAIRNINADASYTIAKYNSNGSLESSSIPTANNTHARIYDVLETSSGEYVVVGSIRNTSTNRTDLFVQKMTSGFSILWTKTFHEDDFAGISVSNPNDHAVAKSVTETSEGSYVIVGSLSRRLSGDDFFMGRHEGSVLIKLDADGEESRISGW